MYLRKVMKYITIKQLEADSQKFLFLLFSHFLQFIFYEQPFGHVPPFLVNIISGI